MRIHIAVVGFLGVLAGSMAWAAEDFSPRTDERQLPGKMYSAMSQKPFVRVGPAEGDIVGKDNRALQSAVDYVTSLGGGTVEIAPGEYLMRDSLHLRPNVTVRGTEGKAVLRKGPSALSPLAIDGDYGEEQITVANPDGFEVGSGVAVWDSQSGGFHTTVARITGRRGNTFSISKPLNADCMISNKAMAATVFPVVSGVEAEGVRIEGLVVEGAKDANANLNGCRGAGIYLYRCSGTVIERCQVRSYNGDGISFQQSNDVTVTDCVSEANAGLGIHPGSGSQRPLVRKCVARGNGEDGLYLCWRVRHGTFEENVLEGNGRYGISIGHKDTDNLLRKNRVAGNKRDGVCFREESLGMAAHRNRLEENVIENNGIGGEAAGIRVMGQTNDLVLKGNTIRDTRNGAEKKQTIGIRIEPKVGPLQVEGNSVDAATAVKDFRPAP